MVTAAAPAGARAEAETFSALERLWHRRTLYVFLAPFAALTLVFGVWPIGQSIYLAFTESYTALSPEPELVGLENFREILGDPRFRASMWATAAYTAASVALNLAVALGLAMLLIQPVLARGRTLFKLALFLPVITPDVAGFIVWKWMVNGDFGALNAVLLSLGLPPFAGVTRAGPAFLTLVGVDMWRHVGLFALIFLTNLQILDRSLSESAEIDGATRWQNFRHVTLPQLRPALAINTVYASIEFLKTFTIVLVMTSGGPNFATNFVSYFAYAKFDQAQYGEAAAMATVLFAGVALISLASLMAFDRTDRR